MKEDAPAQISENVVVKIEYMLRVNDEVLDSSEQEGPLEYLHGHGNIVAGLEAALTGKMIGDRLRVTVSPEQGYGAYDEQAVAFVPRIEIPGEIPLVAGTELVFEDDEGNFLEATINWIGADEVKLDFNHPLAGETLDFDIRVVGLRKATEQELEHGHAHPEGADHAH